MSENAFYLTTPIYYVNARPHIGHAYSTIVADVLARRHRLLGDSTYFLTGTDEHGQKIERSAAAAGIPPQQFADQVSKTFADLWARMGITHDQFIRTTDPKHKLGAQQLFRTLYERGDIYLSSYTGQYSIGEEMFVEGPPGTIGPDGRPTETVTEENFFFRLSKYQADLIDLIEPGPNGELAKLLITPESSRNEVLSFLRGDYHAVVIAYKQKSTGVNLPAYTLQDFNECVSAGLLKLSAAGTHYVPGALKDLSISRSSFTWGIPVPEDIQLAAGAKEKHVIYVWLDALANYITALGYGSVNEDGSAGDTTLFDKFWPADIHLVGKEITRFHCVYWPAFLLAAGLPTPKQVTANGWLLFDNSKMSKSKGNVVRTETILDAFGTLCPPPLSHNPNSVILGGDSRHLASEPKDPGASDPATAAGTIQTTSVLLKGSASAVPQIPQNDTALAAGGALQPTPHDRDLFAADVLRYYLLREIPFGQDGSFSFDSLITRYNADLANGYGNLVSRTLNMLSKYFDGVIPEINEENAAKIAFLGNLQITFGNKTKALEPLLADFEELRLDKYLQGVSVLITVADQTISLMTPWKERETEAATNLNRAFALHHVAESIRIITALLYPILPYATARVWKQLGFEKPIEQAALDGQLKNLQWGGLKPGTKLGPLGPIFPRADKGLAQIMTDMENPSTPSELSSRPERSEAERPAVDAATSDPAAPPRTSSLPEPSGTLTVGGSTAHTTGPAATQSHTDIPGSGIFAQPTAPAEPEATPQITIDDFAKIELRVAQITLAERIPKADKLLRLEVDLGPFGTRQILSGIAEWYTPEDLQGKRIIVITNLGPRKMRGLESHGMLLAASDGDHGKPHLATCGEEIPLGSRLK